MRMEISPGGDVSSDTRPPVNGTSSSIRFGLWTTVVSTTMRTEEAGRCQRVVIVLDRCHGGGEWVAQTSCTDDRGMDVRLTIPVRT